MSKQVLQRFNRMVDNAIVVLGTEEIIPAMVFAKLGKMSVYIEHYYMHTPRMMILIIEPVFIPKCRGYAPSLKQRLLDTILLRLASTTFVASTQSSTHYTYINTFMARHFVAADLLRKLALAIEEGITVDEADPDLNTDLQYIFKNFAYAQTMETSFYAPHLKGSYY